MHASLHGAAVQSGAQAFDPNQKGGTSFVRRTTKYWVQTKDVLKARAGGAERLRSSPRLSHSRTGL